MIPDDKVRRAHAALSRIVMTERLQHISSTYTHPIDTDLPSSNAPDRSTPRAQTRQEYEEDGKRRSARVSVSLAGKHQVTLFTHSANESRYRRIRRYQRVRDCIELHLRK